MKTYLLRVCAFKKDFDDLCNAYQCRSLVFYDFNEALKMGKAILKYQIDALFKINDLKEYYKKANDEFIEDCIEYIFGIEESDPDMQKKWKGNSDHMYWEIENPYLIDWEFDFKGNLTGRWFGGKPQYNDVIRAYSCGSYDFRPGDEQPNAGMRFSVGDFVCSKDKKEKIYIVGGIPLKKGKYFENYYTCEFIDNGYLNHFHPHESDIEKYTGEVPENLIWLSRYFKGEIKISDEDSKKIFNGEYCFDERPLYKTIIEIKA